MVAHDLRGYFRWRNLEPEQRFWKFLERIDTNDQSKCWPWPGSRQTFGYGRIVIRGKTYLAHRLAWTITNGPIPAGFFVCHKCDNPPCCNPNHLYAGTQKDNIQDCSEKGRLVDNRGERCGTSKLNPEQILEIRKRFDEGEQQKTLYLEFGISATQMHRIVHRKRWAHI